MAEFGEVVVFNGGVDKAHEIAFVTKVIDDADGIVNLLVFDGDGNGTIETEVPRRAPADYEAGGGGGYTWHYASEDLGND